MTKDDKKVSGLELTRDMLLQIDKFVHTLSPEHVDLSRITFYDKEFDKYDEIPLTELELLSLQTLRAVDLLTEYHYIANRFAAYSHIDYDKTSSTLYFVEAPSLLKAENTKDSDAARKRIIDQMDAYVKSKDLRDAWEALRDYFEEKRENFVKKHYFLKLKFDQLSNGGNK